MKNTCLVFETMQNGYYYCRCQSKQVNDILRVVRSVLKLWLRKPRQGKSILFNDKFFWIKRYIHIAMQCVVIIRTTFDFPFLRLNCYKTVGAYIYSLLPELSFIYFIIWNRTMYLEGLFVIFFKCSTGLTNVWKFIFKPITFNI